MDEDFRLPRTVEPVHYDITLRPDLSSWTFTGDEQVELRIVDATSTIVLNAVDLTIKRATVVDGLGKRIEASVALDPEAERATFTLPAALPPGTATLELSFTGEINDKLRGFYRSTFRDDAGVEHAIATSQFEATDARRAIPCWDEPDRKAVFAVTLVVDENLTALSNSPLDVETADSDAANNDGTKTVRFADTIIMSTYLLAFVVGPFEITDPVDVDGVALRVACRPGQLPLTGFALEIGAHALHFFTQWFGIPYPAAKLDLIAVPDFAFGAMENLGCVTFRETLLIIDPQRASRAELEAVADVVAHEIAHMWFGDLVTMKWWNGIWLNEAFATFMELLCVDDFRPEWERWVSFSSGRAAALTVDGLRSTRPVEYPVARPEEAEGMFDVLTYQKGASVLRMFEQYLGTAAFRKGIHQYLVDHAHGNAETTDLWDAIEAATGEPARAALDSWIFQGGYPLVRVSAQGSTVTLRQEPFVYLGSANGSSARRWHVPVVLRATGAGAREPVTQRVLLDGETTSVELQGADRGIVANAGGWGFFRVAYDGALFEALRGALSDLDPIERCTLVDDAWAGALAGLTSLASFIDLAAGLGNERSPDVWATALGPFGLLDRMTEDRTPIQAFLRRLAGPVLADLGWEREPGEPEQFRALRPTLIESLGVLGADPEVRARAAALFDDPASVDPDIAGAVSRIVAYTGDEDVLAELLARWKSASTPQEEIRYLYALASFQDTNLLGRILDLTLTEVRTQNAPYLLQLLLRNREGGRDTWRFITDHWDEILAKFPDNAIPRMLEGVTALSGSLELATEVRAFLESHPTRSGHQLIAQHLERLDINVAFRRRETPALSALLGITD